MSEAAMEADNDLYRALADIRGALTKSWGVDWILTGLGPHGVLYTAAEDSEEPEEGDYATVGFILPDGFYAEIESDTYGQLQGLRVYRNDLGTEPAA